MEYSNLGYHYNIREKLPDVLGSFFVFILILYIEFSKLKLVYTMNFFRTLFILILLTSGTVNAQLQIVGTWKTIDDNTGKPRSIVEIYKKGDKLFGKIKQILNEAERNKLCIECKGEGYNKPIEGMVIIKNLQKDGDKYEDGTILDPENGKVYRCKIWVDEDNPNVLNVRGYIAFLYRTQKWLKV